MNSVVQINRVGAFIVKRPEVCSLLLLAERRPQWFGSRCSGRKDRGSTPSTFQFRLEILSVIPLVAIRKLSVQ